MKFIISEKPEDLDWDQLARLQYIAHSDNRDNGIDQSCAHMTGEQLKTKIGNGRCFVAIVEDKVVGMVCYKIVDNYRRYWFCNGEKTAELLYTAVLPEYQKGSLFFKLVMTRNAAIEDDGATLIVTDTHVNNKKMRDIFKLYGYEEVCMYKYPSCEYFSVVYANWLTSCPYTGRFIKYKYEMSKILLRLVYNGEAQYGIPYRILRWVKRLIFSKK